MFFFLPKQFQKSTSILEDRSRSLGLFWKGKTCIVATLFWKGKTCIVALLQRIDLVIVVILEREKTLFIAE